MASYGDKDCRGTGASRIRAQGGLMAHALTVGVDGGMTASPTCDMALHQLVTGLMSWRHLGDGQRWRDRRGWTGGPLGRAGEAHQAVTTHR
jgi:hypothetical protein